MDPCTIEEGFGLLRALMQTRAPLVHDATLMPWLMEVESHDPERYHTQWVPYLASFPQHWQASVMCVNTIEALEHAARVAPFALFEFDGSAWAGLRRHAQQEGKVEPRGWPPGFLTYYGFNDAKIREFVQCEALDQLVDLNLRWGGLTPKGIEVLATCPRLTNLKKLTLQYHYQIGDEGVEALIASPYIRGLTYLNLTQTHATAKGFLRLTESEFSRHLQTLDYGNDIDDAPIGQAFLSSTCLNRLEHLSFCDISSQNVVDVMKSPRASNLRTFEFTPFDAMTIVQMEVFSMTAHLEGLQELDLSNLELTDRHMKLLAQSPTLLSLKTLNLSGNAITSEGVGHLATSTWMEGITSLNLSNNPLDGHLFTHLVQSSCRLEALTIESGYEQDPLELDVGLAMWIASPGSTALRELTIELKSSSQCMHALASTDHITSFQHLHVSNLDADPAGVIALLESSVSNTLTHLNLSNMWEDIPNTSTAVCQALASSCHIERLTHLNLCGIEMTDEALIAISRAPHCISLTHLDISSNSFSKAALKVFASSPYFANVMRLDIDLDGDEHDQEPPEAWEILRHSPYLCESVRAQFDPALELEW